MNFKWLKLFLKHFFHWKIKGEKKIAMTAAFFFSPTPNLPYCSFLKCNFDSKNMNIKMVKSRTYIFSGPFPTVSLVPKKPWGIQEFKGKNKETDRRQLAVNLRESLSYIFTFTKTKQGKHTVNKDQINDICGPSIRKNGSLLWIFIESLATLRISSAYSLLRSGFFLCCRLSPHPTHILNI